MLYAEDPIGLAGGNPTIYGYVFNALREIDLFGLDVKTGTGRTHVTYIGVKNGLPWEIEGRCKGDS